MLDVLMASARLGCQVLVEVDRTQPDEHMFVAVVVTGKPGRTRRVFDTEHARFTLTRSQARALYDEKVLAVARKDETAWTRSVVFMRFAELALESASPPA